MLQISALQKKDNGRYSCSLGDGNTTMPGLTSSQASLLPPFAKAQWTPLEATSVSVKIVWALDRSTVGTQVSGTQCYLPL